MSTEDVEKENRLFPGLNGIPWYDLKHAYGSAEEVPMWLRQLASRDEHVRKPALNHLWGSLCHQGWICPATAYAVPYLLALLQEPSVRGKGEILEFLAGIAEADPELYEEQWRTNTSVPEWNVPESVPFKNTRVEVSKGIPLFIALFDHEDQAVRMEAMHVFSCVASPTVEQRSHLLAAFRRERELVVRANLVLALGALSRPRPEEWRFFVELVQSHEEDLLAFSAATVLVQLAKRETPDEVAQFLARVMLDRPEALKAYAELPCRGGAPWLAAGRALASLGSERLGFIVPTLPAMFARAKKWEDAMLADALVAMFFAEGQPDAGEKQEKRTQADLTDTQWTVLNLLADQKGIWGFANLSERLRAYGLPAYRHDLLRFLGREIPPPVLPSVRPHTEKRSSDLMYLFRQALQEKYPEVRVRTIAQTSASDDMTINEDFIFRVPGSLQAIEEMGRERALLQVLHGRLPLPIPRPLYTSEGAQEVGRAFMGYPKLPGKPLYKEMYESIDGEERQQVVASQLGSFLSALHHFPLAELDGLVLPVKHRREMYEALYAHAKEMVFPQLDVETREQMVACFETFLDTAHHFTLPPVLVHGSFGPRAILYDAQTRSIGGIVGFTRAGLGDPALDLAGLVGPNGYGQRFAQWFESFYPELSAFQGRLQFYAMVLYLQEALSDLEQHPEREVIGQMTFFPA